jgi:hypothetical protein
MCVRISIILFSTIGLMLVNCGRKIDPQTPTFTKADSLTDLYLSLQDSMLQSWNIIINDDNQKIKAMHNLLHELSITSSSAELHAYEEQLEHLKDLRYNQKSLAQEDIIEEYDFASRLLITELIGIAESRTEFAYNTTLQKLVEEIRVANQRVAFYRQGYDAITRKYNSFLQANRNYLYEINENDSLELKPLFQMTNGE